MKWFLLLCLCLSLIPVRAAANPQAPPTPTLAQALAITADDVALVEYGLCYTGCGGVFGVPSANEAYEQQVIELVNAQRLANGNLPPLKWVDTLTDAARYHATDMGQDDYFNHDTYDRVNGALVKVCGTWDRVVGYYGSGWSALAENIAAGYSTPEQVMAGWMNSSGHRANILNPHLREIGVGYASVTGSTYTRYWVQNFGAKSGRYPLVINREAATTDDYRVDLYIYGADVWNEMRLRNNAEPWTSWQPFQTELVWHLPLTRGLHTVTVELRQGSMTTSSSDTIYLTRDYLATLGNVPATATFIYSLAEQRFTPENLQVEPRNVTSETSLVWTLTQSGTWFTLSATSGTTPQSFVITPRSDLVLEPGIYTGSVTITVTEPPGTQNSPHNIQLTLQVFEEGMRRLYLPLVRK